MSGPSDLTDLLQRAQTGDAAADSLYTAVYGELRQLARLRLRGRGRDALLDTTPLVHESYLRFAQVSGPGH